MSETDIVTVGRALPKLRSVEPANGPFGIRIVWADGPRADHVDVVDLAPIILTLKVFKPLRDDTCLFQTVHLGDWGASIVWDGHDDLEIGADSLEDLIAETMTSADFADFMKRHGLTLDTTAAHLGISRRMVAYYAKERDVPRYIGLACRYLDTTLSPSRDVRTAAVDDCVLGLVGTSEIPGVRRQDGLWVMLSSSLTAKEPGAPAYALVRGAYPRRVQGTALGDMDYLSVLRPPKGR